MDVLKFKAKMVEKGVSIENIARVINVNASTFYRKLSKENGDVFSIKEVKKIKEKLELSNQEAIEIFLT